MRLLCAAGALVLACAVDARSQDLTFSRDDYASYAGARAIATADFDRNGWPDVAHANLGRNTVTILLNHSASVLATTFDVPVGAGPFDLTTGDFNRDGIPDLAVANADGHSISVLLGRGNGSFTRTDVAAPSQNPRGITTADVNKDGKPDLIYTGFASRTVQVLVGNGAGGFSSGATYVGSPSNPQGLATADFNHDGHLDVALAYASSGGLRILYGNGGTSFSGRTIPGATYLNVVATGDFNADGWADVAAASTPNSTVAIYLGSATGLVHTQTCLTGASPRGITAADLNHDGALDLITANRGSSTVSVLLADRSQPGAFLAHLEVGAGSGSRAVAAEDFNGDGRLDLAAAGEYASSVTVLSNETVFTRAAYVFSRTTLAAPDDDFTFGRALGTADFNRDGKLDVVMAREPGEDEPATMSVVLTGGATISLWVGYLGAFAVADVNADGNPDIVYFSSWDSNRISAFLGDGRGGFTPSPPSVATAVGLSRMVVGDLNRDGRPDLVVVGQEWGEGTSFVLPMIGKGDGTFVEGTRVYDGILYWARALTIVDLNRDGKLDFVALVDGALRIWPGDGAGGLGPPAELIASAPGEIVKFADLNADGYVDATFTDGWGVHIALGGAGGFGALVHTSAYTLCANDAQVWGYSCWVRNPYMFEVGDINHDGTLDIVTAGGDVVPGNGDGTFGLAETFEYDAPGIALADFTRDGLLDILYSTPEGEMVVIVNERNDRNRTPTVTAGPDRTLAYQDLTWVDGDRPCFIIPAVGEDPDLHRLWYEWRDGSGAVVSREREFSLCAVPGTYEYRVTVGDARGGAASDSVVLTIVPTKEIVLHVANRAEFIGTWTAISDPSAASGVRAYNANLGAPKVTVPVPYPENYVGIPFVADPTQVYKLWVRLRADNNSWANDSVWVQFSGAADPAGTPKYTLGSTSGLAVSLEECVNCGVSGWGWEDDGWGALNTNGILLRFPSGGEQYLWIQTREDGVSIDQIVLSAEKYLTIRPGAAKNDHTILPATYAR
jgi:hypothetical protein